ncbi:MAG: hypothetical protein AVDCRST_MAG26-4206, partial [uncultured Chloroflexia bacterium]
MEIPLLASNAVAAILRILGVREFLYSPTGNTVELLTGKLGLVSRCHRRIIQSHSAVTAFVGIGGGF